MVHAGNTVGWLSAWCRTVSVLRRGVNAFARVATMGWHAVAVLR